MRRLLLSFTALSLLCAGQGCCKVAGLCDCDINTHLYSYYPPPVPRIMPVSHSVEPIQEMPKAAVQLETPPAPKVSDSPAPKVSDDKPEK